MTSILAKHNISLSKPKLNVVLQIVEDNIKYNRARRRTSYKDVINLAIQFTNYIFGGM